MCWLCNIFDSGEEGCACYVVYLTVVTQGVLVTVQTVGGGALTLVSDAHPCHTC